MAQAFEEQTAMPDIAELSFDDRLSLLLEREKTEREQRRYVRLKGLAKLHLDATIEDLNFRAPRGLDRSLVLRLASGQVDPGRPDRPRQQRDRVGEVVPRLCARPPGLPRRHLDPLLPRLLAPRRTHPRPGRRIVSQAHPAARQDVAPHPRRLGTRFALRPGTPRPPRGPRRIAMPAVACCSPARSTSTTSTMSSATPP